MVNQLQHEFEPIEQTFDARSRLLRDRIATKASRADTSGGFAPAPGFRRFSILPSWPFGRFADFVGGLDHVVSQRLHALVLYSREARHDRIRQTGAADSDLPDERRCLLGDSDYGLEPPPFPGRQAPAFPAQCGGA
jgi:hypothetical protein